MDKKKKIITGIVAGICLLAVGGGTYFLRMQQQQEAELEQAVAADTVKAAPKVYKYNIPDEAYRILYGEVKSGENLSLILSEQGLQPNEIHELNLKTEGGLRRP